MLKIFLLGLSLALCGATAALAQVDAAAIEQIVPDQRNSDALSDDELAARIRVLQDGLQQDLNDDTKVQLGAMLQADTDAFERRKQAAAQGSEPQAQPDAAANGDGASGEAAPATSTEQPAIEAQPTTDQQAPTPDTAAEDPVAQEAASLLADQRPSSEWSDEDVQGKFKTARDLLRRKDLPAQFKGPLKELVAAARQELAARKAAAEQPAVVEQPATVQQPAVGEQPATTDQPAVVEQPATTDQPAVAQDNGEDPIALEVSKLIADQRPASEWSDEEIRAKFKTARDLLRTKDLPDQFKGPLKDVLTAAREEAQARKAKAEQPQDNAQTPAADQPAVVEQPATADQPAVVEQPATTDQPAVAQDNGEDPIALEVSKLVSDQRPASEWSDEEIRAKFKTARDLLRTKDLPDQFKGPLKDVLTAAREEAQARKAKAEPPQDNAQTPAADQPAVVEQPATADQPAVVEQPATTDQPAVAQDNGEDPIALEVSKLVSDQRPASEWSDEEIRAKFKTARDLLRTKDLPDQFKGPLKDVLTAAREEAQARKAKAEQPQDTAQTPAADQPAVVEQPATTDQPAVAQDNGEDPIALEVSKLVSDQRPASEWSDEEIRAKFKTARDLLRTKDLPDQFKGPLKDVLTAAREEAQARKAKAEQPQDTAQTPAADQPALAEEAPAQGGGPGEALTIEASTLISDERPSGEWSDDEVQAKFAAAQALLASKDLPKQFRDPLKIIVDGARQEAAARAAKPVQPDPAQVANTAKTDQTLVLPDVAAEDPLVGEAVALIKDGAPPPSLSDDELKAKAARIRDLVRSPDMPNRLKRRLSARLQGLQQELDARQAGINAEPDTGQAATQQGGGVADPVARRAAALIGDTRSSGALSDRELQAKIDAVGAVLASPTLGEELKQPLLAVLEDARLEKSARDASVAVPAATPQTTGTQAGTTPQTTAPVAPVVVQDKAVLAATNLITDDRVPADLTDGDLDVKLNAVRALLINPTLAPEFKLALKEIGDGLRQEIADRKAAAAAAQQTQAATPVVNIAPPGGTRPKEALVILGDKRAIAAFADAELRSRLEGARIILRDPDLNEDVRADLESLVVATRGELRKREASKAPVKVNTGTTAPVFDPDAGQQNTAIDKPVVVPEAEKAALAFLKRLTPSDKLDDVKLRARLETMRNMLEDGDLSRETERLLRQRLKVDREALRTRIVVADAAAEEAAARKAAAAKKAAADKARLSPKTGKPLLADGKPVKPGKASPVEADIDPLLVLEPGITIRPPRREDRAQIVADRRPATDLDDEELNHRIQVYRDLIKNPAYSPKQRAFYATAMRLDRLELGNRMRQGRQDRKQVLAQPKVIQQYSIRLGGNRPAPRVPPKAVYAAEVSDAAIEQQLITPPVQRIRTQVSYQQLQDDGDAIIAEPSLRVSLPGVELDTITFGSNEAFVREEEVADLDRIGRILEKILAARPKEIFMIEGHTDAVGDDRSNAILSKKRAEAVKAALLEYYVIDARNLVTVGLGERYLKIPTPEAEEENRRVTIRRVTDLVRK